MTLRVLMIPMTAIRHRRSGAAHTRNHQRHLRRYERGKCVLRYSRVRRPSGRYRPRLRQQDTHPSTATCALAISFLSAQRASFRPICLMPLRSAASPSATTSPLIQRDSLRPILFVLTRPLVSTQFLRKEGASHPLAFSLVSGRRLTADQLMRLLLYLRPHLYLRPPRVSVALRFKNLTILSPTRVARSLPAWGATIILMTPILTT